MVYWLAPALLHLLCSPTIEQQYIAITNPWVYVAGEFNRNMVELQSLSLARQRGVTFAVLHPPTQNASMP